MKQTRPKIIFAKRLLDIVLSSFILIITLPFSATALFLIKIVQILDGGLFHPLFYKETRMSHGVPFTLYKFNIFKHRMILEAKARGEFIHTKYFEKNGGVTVVGWVLKQIYMDELPQFFNVLKGDLSIVGPRPVNLEVYQNLMDNGHFAKNQVRAGITGRYQSMKNLTETTKITDRDMDQEYADYYHHHNWYQVLWFDLTIMFQTVAVIFKARGI
tara:strand:- start:725 stop:1369 length:645 start_codon:yes stop_codon:yes gene_type:complete